MGEDGANDRRELKALHKQAAEERTQIKNLLLANPLSERRPDDEPSLTGTNAPSTLQQEGSWWDGRVEGVCNGGSMCDFSLLRFTPNDARQNHVAQLIRI